jgi:hypothetical protein
MAKKGILGGFTHQILKFLLRNLQNSYLNSSGKQAIYEKNAEILFNLIFKKKPNFTKSSYG